MSARVLETSKYSVGDLVELTEPMDSHLDISNYVGKVAKVTDVYRKSRHGYYKWAVHLEFPGARTVRVFSKYKFTDTKLKVIFKV